MHFFAIWIYVTEINSFKNCETYQEFCSQILTKRLKFPCSWKMFEFGYFKKICRKTFRGGWIGIWGGDELGEEVEKNILVKTCSLFKCTIKYINSEYHVNFCFSFFFIFYLECANSSYLLFLQKNTYFDEMLVYKITSFLLNPLSPSKTIFKLFLIMILNDIKLTKFF